MMRGFCGAYNGVGREVELCTVRRMGSGCRDGCAYINGGYGVLYKGTQDVLSQNLQPITLSHNNDLYTLTIMSETAVSDAEADVARAVIEGYVEEGEEYVYRLDFPYSLALYDARRAELRLFVGSRGGKPMFYAVQDGVLYFSTSVTDVLRALGGCAKVSVEVLRAYLLSGYSPYPKGLYADIISLDNSECVMCSPLGIQTYKMPTVMCSYEEHPRREAHRRYSGEKTEIKKCLDNALAAFGYPQFDCYMPLAMAAAQGCAKKGERSISVSDPLETVCAKYAQERLERLGGAFGVRLIQLVSDGDISRRDMKNMEFELDGILEDKISGASRNFYGILSEDDVRKLFAHKLIQRRIRAKAMLCQCAAWLEEFNVLLV